ncbi:MAG: hypothetical protein ACYTAF_00295, partial [Planctomycetota bacterium]|jgi:hypothetical protein
VEIQVHFIRKLKKGTEMTLEIRHAERDVFEILELNDDQREWARKKDEKKHDKKHEAKDLPKGVIGFSGRVRGVVKGKLDKGGFLFYVGRILKTWKDNKARHPDKLKGMTIKIGPRWQKAKDGKWHQVEIQVLFIRKLKKNMEMTLEIAFAEGDWFHILELTEEQRAWARKKGDGGGDKYRGGDDGIPKSLFGFSGMVGGIVKGKTDNDGMLFKVVRIDKIWEGNKAKDPEAIIGRTVKVEPRWQKGDDGKWHKVEIHVAFIRNAKIGDDFHLEIQHAERDVFQILELNEEQRGIARKGGGGDRKRDRDEGPEHDFPKAVLGFSGKVRGVVTSKNDDGTFFFYIGRVLKVWEDNKASKPNKLAGMTVRIGPRWEKGDDGKWHKVDIHELFIKKLQKEDELNLEIFHAEADRFAILELSEEQAKWADGD